MKFSDDLTLLTCKNLLAFPRILHFATTRHGGVSKGDYASLNLSFYSGDSKENVTENRRLLAKRLQIEPEQIIVPYQVHNDVIRIIPSDFARYSEEEKTNFLNGVDALITNFPDFCIAVTTADCVPLLLYDPVKNVVAAVHAGWKGTVKRIAEKTLCLMQQQFECNPENIRVAIGPCIGRAAFEVGDEVLDAFEQAGFPVAFISFFNKETAKHHIDLVQANVFGLCKMNVKPEHIAISTSCTYANPDFFSARRLGINSGRLLSGIMIKPQISNLKSQISNLKH